MSNQVTKAAAGGALASLQALKSNLQQVRQRLPENTGVPFLRFLTDGEWVFGQEDNVLKEGTELLVNVLSIKQGYTCWTNRAVGEGKNEKLGEEMFNLGQPIPSKLELPRMEDSKSGKACEWKDQMSVEMKILDGKHKGTQVLYTASSVGGLNTLRGIMDAILARMDEGTESVFPCVSLGSDSYKHNKYGKTYVPVLDISGWADMNGKFEDDEDDEPAEPERLEKDEEPKQAPEPEQEEATDDAPRRRRRRV